MVHGWSLQNNQKNTNTYTHNQPTNQHTPPVHPAFLSPCLCLSLSLSVSLSPLKTIKKKQVLVAQKVTAGVYKGVTTHELDELAAETAASMTAKHPDY